MMMKYSIRTLDILLATVGLLLLSPLFVSIYFFGFRFKGNPIFQQFRVGRNKKPFILYKFRTMNPDAPQIATHLISSDLVTPWGSFLRRNKLDELPQLWNVIRGDMSFVGPRPCLLSQEEIIEMRTTQNLFSMRPGITGLAQIRGVDMSNPAQLTETDAEMMKSFSVGKYCTYLLLTLFGFGRGDRIK